MRRQHPIIGNVSREEALRRVLWQTRGHRNAKGGIGHLHLSAEAFLRQLKKTGWCKP